MRHFNQVVFSGISIASVLGVPFGTFIGRSNWRIAFWAIAGIGVLILAAVIFLVPSLEPRAVVPLAELPKLLRDGTLAALLMTRYRIARPE
ncbi:hypothetical protein [Streptomyces sp. NPDC101776]|uniref:hypothetical protein n=1 Tax=Streptomyces sp. NPDC101776 TaxID=3366146 RepID=UPI0037F1D053